MDFPDEVSVPAASSPPLAGVLSRTSVDRLTDGVTFRRYGGRLVTTTQVRGKSDVSSKPVGYSIGVRSPTRPMGVAWDASTPQVDQRFSIEPSAQAEISGILRRYSNFGNDVATADLAAIVFLLAAGCAKYSATGSLTCGDLRMGEHISIASLSVQDRVTTRRGAVFIPRHSAMVDVPGMFEAMAAAANGAGASVVTDVLAVDPLNNAPRVLEPQGAELAQACWSGLRGLLHLYDTSGYGAIAALAATKGFHSVLTVVGHTDEGAIMRSVLRKGRYAVPHGCILVSGLDNYVGLPTYRRIGDVSQQCAVDGICLMTAAATSVCDPLVEMDGRSYPTVFTSYAGAQEEGGSENVGTAADSRSVSTQIASSSGPFCDLYVSELCRLFMVRGGEREAARAMGYMFTLIAGTDDRHLRHRAVAPYYWVEPTSLYRTAPDTPATKGGYGPLCGTDTEHSLPVAEVVSFHGVHYYDQAVDMQWRSARTSGWAVHMLGNQFGGAAHFRFRQADPEMFAFRGAGEAASTREAMKSGETLDQFMWGHANCMIPAPAECLYTGRRVRVMSTVATPAEGFMSEEMHTFSHLDLSSQKGQVVLCRAIRPSAIPPGGVVDDRRTIRRARAGAEMALELARSAVSRGPAANAVFLNVAFTEPSAPSAVEGVTEAPTAAALAPEVASEELMPARRAQGPASAHIMLQRALQTRVKGGGESYGGGGAPAVQAGADGEPPSLGEENDPGGASAAPPSAPTLAMEVEAGAPDAEN